MSRFGAYRAVRHRSVTSSTATAQDKEKLSLNEFGGPVSIYWDINTAVNSNVLIKHDLAFILVISLRPCELYVKPFLPNDVSTQLLLTLLRIAVVANVRCEQAAASVMAANESRPRYPMNAIASQRHQTYPQFLLACLWVTCLQLA